MKSSVDTSAGQAGTKDDALRSMEHHIDELPLLPQVLVRILQLDSASDRYFEQFEELASEDPAFAVRVVALANSAASSPVVPIVTIRDALARMGSATINSMVASLSVQRVFMPTQPSQVRLWCHAVETAVTSEAIARLFPEVKLDSAQAYLTGLLHDIGRFVMLEHAAPELKKVDESEWKSPEELIQADIDVYNFTHSELGYLACKRWGLPDALGKVIRVHHDAFEERLLPGSMAAAVACVQVADRIGIYLLGDPGTEKLTDVEVQEVIENDCLRTDDEKATFPAASLSVSVTAMRDRSRQILSGLGFS